MATQLAKFVGGNDWPVAEPVQKRFKIFIAGPPGCFKTRVALGLADNKNRNNPAAAVIDTEYGSKHYAGEFAFRRQESFEPGHIYRLVKGLAKEPGDITTLVFDSFSVYYDALMESWVEKFARRELTSAGNKGEYYTLQPRDYVHINRDAGKLVRLMLNSDMNVICTCQVKAEWDNMKVVGSIFDGWKRLPYFFDIYIFVEEWKKQGGAMGWKAYVKGKDRTGCLSPGQKIDWEDSASIVAYLTEKLGQSLSKMPKAIGYDADTDRSVSEVSADVERQAQEAGELEGTSDKKGAPKEDEGRAPAPDPVPDPVDGRQDIETDTPGDTPGLDCTPVDPDRKDLLVEIVRLKKACKITDPNVWGKMVTKYMHVKTGNPLKTATEMVVWQAEDLIKTLARMAP